MAPHQNWTVRSFRGVPLKGQVSQVRRGFRWSARSEGPIAAHINRGVQRGYHMMNHHFLIGFHQPRLYNKNIEKYHGPFWDSYIILYHVNYSIFLCNISLPVSSTSRQRWGQGHCRDDVVGPRLFRPGGALGAARLQRGAGAAFKKAHESIGDHRAQLDQMYML